MENYGAPVALFHAMEALHMTNIELDGEMLNANDVADMTEFINRHAGWLAYEKLSRVFAYLIETGWHLTPGSPAHNGRIDALKHVWHARYQVGQIACPGLTWKQEPYLPE